MTAGLLALLHKITGSVLVLLGAVLLPMPIPLGLIFLVFGLALLAPYFVPVQKFIRHMRRKYPAFDEKMLSIKSRCPKVIQTAIEKTSPHLKDGEAA